VRCQVRRNINGIDYDLGILGGFVRIADARKLLDLAGTSERVQAFAIPLLTDLDRRRDVNLDKAANLRRGFTNRYGAIGAQMAIPPFLVISLAT